MKTILLNALVLAVMAFSSCSDDDSPSQVCLDCTHPGGSTTEQCGSAADMDELEEIWIEGGGTCTRK